MQRKKIAMLLFPVSSSCGKEPIVKLLKKLGVGNKKVIEIPEISSFKKQNAATHLSLEPRCDRTAILNG
jgi:hypothetical protein